MSVTTEDRAVGAFLGLAIGDAVGTTVEFMPRGTFPEVTDMVGGGPFKLKAGQWTDDTSMALCIAQSLLDNSSFDEVDIMDKFVKWMESGYFSATGKCFDVGATTRMALEDWRDKGSVEEQILYPFNPPSGDFSAGNGSLMRLAPIPMFYYNNINEGMYRSRQSSQLTTHGSPEAYLSCQVFSAMITTALNGGSKAHISASMLLPSLKVNDRNTDNLQTLVRDQTYLFKSRDQIRGNGYAVDSLEAALWCFYNTDTFEAAILAAANLGDDADTTAAIVGQLAGAFYGESGIRADWLTKLQDREMIGGMAEKLLTLNGQLCQTI